MSDAYRTAWDEPEPPDDLAPEQAAKVRAMLPAADKQNGSDDEDDAA